MDELMNEYASDSVYVLLYSILLYVSEGTLALNALFNAKGKLNRDSYVSLQTFSKNRRAKLRLSACA